MLLVTADHATGGLFLEPGKALGLGDLPSQDARVEEKEASPPTGSDRGPETNGVVIKKPDYASPFVYPDGEVSYDTAGHTNELVDLAVTGAAARGFLRLRGTWYPGPILDNTQINAALREALGLGASSRRSRRAG